MKGKHFIVLDRDGTIIVERHYLSDPAQVELLPGAVSGLRQLRRMGFGLIVITNQSGIGRGFFNEERLGLIHLRMIELLEAENVSLDGIYFCPHLPEDNCSCRKPQPGLLYLAAKERGFDPQSCFVIGDKACDIELGKLVGATTLLVRTGYGNQMMTESTLQPDYIVDNLQAASGVIQKVVAIDERKGFQTVR
jgi:D-glycero-D-manno-heptose 1,7-bisphosphate phosphatase